MIKVVYTYSTKIVNSEELMEKFIQSTDPKFSTDVNNVKIERFKKIVDDKIIVVLDIYYNNMEEFLIRNRFENDNDDWCKIWFDKNNKHEELSVEIFEVME